MPEQPTGPSSAPFAAEHDWANHAQQRIDEAMAWADAADADRRATEARADAAVIRADMLQVQLEQLTSVRPQTENRRKQ